jgi:hypothetical protein
MRDFFRKTFLFLILLSPAISFADTTTPNMGLEVNPAWPSDLQADMSIIDSHNHASGNGVAITPSGLNINAPLPFNGNPATSVDYVTLVDAGVGPSVPITAWSNGVDLFFEDGNGNKIQVTANGAVNALQNFGDAGYFVPGYASTSINVDGGITLVKDGGCFLTYDGVAYCDDGAGNAVINAPLNQDILFENGGSQFGFFTTSGLYLASPLDLSVSGNSQVTGNSRTFTLTVTEGAFIDGGLSVYGPLYVDGGMNVVDTLTAHTITGTTAVYGSNLINGGSQMTAGTNYTHAAFAQGNNSVGADVGATTGALVLLTTTGNVLTQNQNNPPTCAALLSACWGSGATCTMGVADTDTNGTFSIATAASTSSCAAGTNLAQINYGEAFNNIPAAIVQLGGDTDAGSAPVLPNVYAATAAADFVLSPTAAFTPNTLSTYTFSYVVLGMTDGGF